MFYNVNIFNELLNFYSSGSKFLKDYLNKFWQVFLKARVFQKADSTKERFNRVSFFKRCLLPKQQW